MSSRTWASLMIQAGLMTMTMISNGKNQNIPFFSHKRFYFM
jgi:hypothetical protein